MKRLSFELTLLVVLASQAARAEEPVCDVASPLEPQRFLRRLSLDLVGTVPAWDEISRLQGQSEVPEATIDRMLSSEGFVKVMRRHHESLLWPNLEEIKLASDANELYPLPMEGGPLWVSPLRSVFVRATGNATYVPCRNEPAEFDTEGRLLTQPLLVAGEEVAEVEGYVEVEPYWAPGTTVKVCGFDALSAERAPVCPGPAERYPFAEPYCSGVAATAASLNVPFRGADAACDGPLSLLAPGCGCGPNLERCFTPETKARVIKSLLDQELRIIESVVRDDRPYDEVLTTKTVEYDGPLAHYLTKMSRTEFDMYGALDPTASVPPARTFTDDTWVPVERQGRHAGVLTTPGYLLRFMSNRGRAHRFHNAFQCQSFIPAGPLPAPSEPCSKHEDLTLRCGCDACHKQLEPMASYFGRFAEYGFGHIDEREFPPRIEGAFLPTPDAEKLFRIFRFYEVDPVGEEEAFRGWLNAYVFRDEQEIEHVVKGPKGLADEAIESGAFAECTVRRMWSLFLRRPMDADEERTVKPTLLAAYDANGRSLRALVKAIVTHPAYGRAP
ncbi:MAG: DUF1549 domain-containing protein [Deltaproteobacteria bacterium]|nr:DUF1549 domain-containing protein [Deltaproteobacteria bacterium]